MKRKIGSVSFFMAMIFLLVMAVLSTTIISARVHGARAIVSTSISTSVDSVFAQFDSELFEKFGVLFFKGNKNSIEEQVTNYLEKNIKTESGLDLFGIEIKSVSLDSIKTAANYGGLLFMDEAVDYEKYAKVINMAADYLGIGGSEEQNTIMDETIEAMVNITDEMEIIRVNMIDIVKEVNGVTFSDQGISENTEKYFINMFSFEGDGFSILLPSAANRIDIIKMISEAASAFEVGKISESDRCLEEIQKYISKVLSLQETLNDSLNIGGFYINLLCQTAVNIQSILEENMEILGENLTTELVKSFDELEKYDELIKEKFCDLEKLKETLSNNIEILSKVQIILSKKIDKESFTDILMLFQQYDTSGYKFDYSFFEVKEKSKNSILKTLKKYFENGILGLVLPEDRTVSFRRIPQYKNQITSECNISTDYYMSYCDELTRDEKKIVYGEYVMDNFKNFLSNSNGTALDYETEYILNGCESDFENLYETVKKIALARSLVNIIYLLTDDEKKEEALGLAMSIIGWADSEALNEIMKYIILYIWSYAEGLLEAKALLMGRKVAIFKTDKNWMLDFSDFLSLNFTVDEEKTKSGLGYETYLRALLMLEDEGKKAVNTMKLEELWKIANGDKEFRFKNCIYSLTGDVTYTINGINKEYTYSFAQTY